MQSEEVRIERTTTWSAGPGGCGALFHIKDRENKQAAGWRICQKNWGKTEDGALV